MALPTNGVKNAYFQSFSHLNNLTFDLGYPVEASPVIVLQETFKKGITPYTTSTGVNHDYDHQLRLLTHKVPIYLFYKAEDVLSKTLFYFLISSTRWLTTPDGSPKTLCLISFFLLSQNMVLNTTAVLSYEDEVLINGR